MTPEGKAHLIEHEGEVLHAYEDSRGFWTIGVGHCIDARAGGTIPQRISRELLDMDLAAAFNAARDHFMWFIDLDSVRRDVITMLVFNMGLKGFATFHLMIDAMQQRNWLSAAKELTTSEWAGQIGAIRRKALHDALETGHW